LRLVIAFFGVTLSLLASTQALASSAIDDAAREFHAAAAAARAFDPTFDDISDQPWANGETRLWNAVEQWTCTCSWVEFRPIRIRLGCFGQGPRRFRGSLVS
jgi:hypothetical protein